MIPDVRQCILRSRSGLERTALRRAPDLANAAPFGGVEASAPPRLTRRKTLKRRSAATKSSAHGFFGCERSTARRSRQSGPLIPPSSRIRQKWIPRKIAATSGRERNLDSGSLAVSLLHPASDLFEPDGHLCPAASLAPVAGSRSDRVDLGYVPWLLARCNDIHVVGGPIAPARSSWVCHDDASWLV